MADMSRTEGSALPRRLESIQSVATPAGSGRKHVHDRHPAARLDLESTRALHRAVRRRCAARLRRGPRHRLDRRLADRIRRRGGSSAPSLTAIARSGRITNKSWIPEHPEGGLSRMGGGVGRYGKERRMRLGSKSVGLGVAVAVAVAAAAFTMGASAADGRGTPLSVRGSDYGNVLFGPGGLVVYMYGPDRRSKSNCYGTCARFWHPLLTKGRPLAGP